MPLPPKLHNFFQGFMDSMRYVARTPVVLLIIIVTIDVAFLLAVAIFRISQWLWNRFLAHPF